MAQSHLSGATTGNSLSDTQKAVFMDPVSLSPANHSLMCICPTPPPLNPLKPQHWIGFCVCVCVCVCGAGEQTQGLVHALPLSYTPSPG
jgi:hypothetical protein